MAFSRSGKEETLMADASVLQEFLVSIGYKFDPAGERRLLDVLETSAKSAAKLGLALEAAAVTTFGVVQRIASNFETLYYTSARVGSSALNIKAFAYAISQLGGTTEGALSSLENFSRKIRESPGQEGFFKQFGVEVKDAHGQLRDMTTVMDEFLHSTFFLKQEPYMRLRFAEMAGIDEKTFRAMMLDLDKKTKEYKDRAGAFGVDPVKAAEGAVKFQQAWGKVLLDIDLLISKVATNFDDNFKGKFEEFDKYLMDNKDGIVNGLETIARFLISIADATAKVIVKFGEWAKASDPWIESITGLKDGFALLAVVIGVTLFTAIGRAIAGLGLLVGGTAWKSLVGVLGALGLGGATFLAATMTPSPLGNEDEAARQAGGHGLGYDEGGGAAKTTWDWIKDKATGGWNRVKAAVGMGGGAGAGADSGGGGGGGKAPEGSLKERGLRLMNNLIDKGWSKESAAMAAGNAEAESGINPSGPAGDGGASVGMFQDQGSRRTALRAFQAAHSEMSKEDSNIAYYDQEAQQQGWKHLKDMSMAGKFSHATEGYGDDTEAKRVRNSHAWLRAYNEAKSAPLAPGIAPKVAEDPARGNAWQAALKELSGSAQASEAKHTWAHNLSDKPPTALVPHAAAPIGHQTHNSVRYGNHSALNQKTNITVNAAGDAGATAKAVAALQNNVNIAALRDMQGSAQ
jgi:Phage tail lysozyme